VKHCIILNKGISVECVRRQLKYLAIYQCRAEVDFSNVSLALTGHKTAPNTPNQAITGSLIRVNVYKN